MNPNIKGLHSDPQNEEPTQDEVQSLEIIERPPSDLSQRQKHELPHPLSIHVIALLIPASIFGVLARLGLNALAQYEGNSIFPLAYAQGVGCLVMGFAVGLKEPLGRFYPPLYTAITAGFCGSLTTFSGWQLDVFDSWRNVGRFPQGSFRSFIDGVGKSVFTIAISIASVSFGLQLAAAVLQHSPSIPPPKRAVRFGITTLSILTYGAVFPTYFLMDADFRHQATAALLFAFPGAFTRYLLSIQLNTLLKTIPLGTFTANCLGTALLGGFSVLLSKTHPVSAGACSLLQGLSDGYCGCVTTVSTFAVEVRGLGMKRGSRYALLSWCVGQLFLLVIVGPSIWTGYAGKHATCTFV